MGGLRRDGFESEDLFSIKAQIEDRIRSLAPNTDFSAASPDGSLIAGVSLAAAEIWTVLGQLAELYNEGYASGEALRNQGLLSGILVKGATKSYASVDLTGTAGTVVKAGSLVSDDSGEWLFEVAFDTVLPNTASVIALDAGALEVPAGFITQPVSAITGWTGVVQAADGVQGTKAMTDGEFKTYKERVVLHNSIESTGTIQAALSFAGAHNAIVVDNDGDTPLPDGTPPGAVHVTVGFLGDLSIEDIAVIIMQNKGLGTPTFGSQQVSLEDSQGYAVDINFDIATEVKAEIHMTVKYLEEDSGGADEAIKRDIAAYVNGLDSGEDVVWSHLFQHITIHAGAQVDSLTLSKKGEVGQQGNLTILETEFASIALEDIDILVAT